MYTFGTHHKSRSRWTTHESRLARKANCPSSRPYSRWVNFFLRVPKHVLNGHIRERYSDWAFLVPQLIGTAAANTDELLVWPIFWVQKIETWHS